METNILYEDEYILVIRPDSEATYNKYSKNTNWKTIMFAEENAYNYLVTRGIISYFIITKNPSKSDLYNNLFKIRYDFLRKEELLRDPSGKTDRNNETYPNGYLIFDANNVEIDNYKVKKYLDNFGRIFNLMKNDTKNLPIPLEYKVFNGIRLSEQEIFEALHHDNKKIRNQALSYIPTLGILELEDLLEDPSFIIRIVTLEEISNRNRKDLVEKMLNDSDERVRISAKNRLK